MREADLAGEGKRARGGRPGRRAYATRRERVAWTTIWALRPPTRSPTRSRCSMLARQSRGRTRPGCGLRHAPTTRSPARWSAPRCSRCCVDRTAGGTGSSSSASRCSSRKGARAAGTSSCRRTAGAAGRFSRCRWGRRIMARSSSGTSPKRMGRGSTCPHPIRSIWPTPSHTSPRANVALRCPRGPRRHAPRPA